MLMLLDLILFGCLFISQIFIFFFLQIIVLRLFPNKDLLYSSVFTAFLSVLIAMILSYFLIAEYFTSKESYVISVVGSGLAAIFASGLYTFLGPVTADRSLASQLLVFLSTMPDSRTTKDNVFKSYNSNGFMEKRFEECRKEQIITETTETVALTKKGKKFAKVYIFLLNALSLRNRVEYRHYFRNDPES